jgi:hypothetical protein
MMSLLLWNTQMKSYFIAAPAFFLSLHLQSSREYPNVASYLKIVPPEALTKDGLDWSKGLAMEVAKAIERVGAISIVGSAHELAIFYRFMLVWKILLHRIPRLTLRLVTRTRLWFTMTN